MNHFQQAVAHLTEMARHPGWIDHARYRCKELEKTELYAGISQAVARELKANPESACTTLGKTQAGDMKPGTALTSNSPATAQRLNQPMTIGPRK